MFYACMQNIRNLASRVNCLATQNCRKMPKGVTKDEKKQRMVAMFRTSKEVFTKKDVESKAVKVGIISNAVEGVLKELVGDDLVREEKVGISTYWWSFPGDATAKKQAERDQLQADIAGLQPKLAGLQEQEQAAAAAAAGAEGEAEQVQALEASIESLRARQQAAQGELAKMSKAGGEDWGGARAAPGPPSAAAPVAVARSLDRECPPARRSQRASRTCTCCSSRPIGGPTTSSRSTRCCRRSTTWRRRRPTSTWRSTTTSTTLRTSSCRHELAGRLRPDREASPARTNTGGWWYVWRLSRGCLSRSWRAAPDEGEPARVCA